MPDPPPLLPPSTPALLAVGQVHGGVSASPSAPLIGLESTSPASGKTKHEPASVPAHFVMLHTAVRTQAWS